MSSFTASHAVFLALAAGRVALADLISITPHDKYSSSAGVLGCKINTNRVAYWPGTVDCNNICVKVTVGSYSTNLLRIDASGGAYDVSYDAWVYLQTGDSATTNPITGGGISATFENVDASECADLILTDGNKLPLTAANSMNFVSSCISSDSWVGNNHVLYNIADAICSLGYDEECTLDLSTSNQPTCPHQLGLQDPLTTDPVYNIEYGTGRLVNAATGQYSSSAGSSSSGSGSGSSGSSSSSSVAAVSTTTWAAPAQTYGTHAAVALVADTTTSLAGGVFVASTESADAATATTSAAAVSAAPAETTESSTVAPAPSTSSSTSTSTSASSTSSSSEVAASTPASSAPATTETPAATTSSSSSATASPLTTVWSTGLNGTTLSVVSLTRTATATASNRVTASASGSATSTFVTVSGAAARHAQTWAAVGLAAAAAVFALF